MGRQRSIAMLLIAAAAIPAGVEAASMGAPFSSLYSITSAGRMPDLPPYSVGGMVFESGSPDDLLIGGLVDYVSGSIFDIGLTRDPITQSVTGYTGSMTSYASATYIDGGLTYGPGGDLFITQYPNNTISEIMPGSTSPDYTETLPGVTSSTGGLSFIPAGFNGAGNAAITSYNGGSICSAPVTASDDGSYQFGTCTGTVTFGSAVEGIQYIAAGMPGFLTNSILVNFYAADQTVAYQLDANGMPILATGNTFLSGIGNPIGITIDPVTGDILVDQITGSVIVVHADAEATSAPEPGTLAMLIAVALVGGWRFFRQTVNKEEIV